MIGSHSHAQRRAAKTASAQRGGSYNTNPDARPNTSQLKQHEKRPNMNDKNCETTHAHKDDTTRGQQQTTKTSSPRKPIQNRRATPRPSTHKQRPTRLRRGSPHNRRIKGFYKTTLQTRLHRVSPHNRRTKGFYKVTLKTTTQARNKSTHRRKIAP